MSSCSSVLEWVPTPWIERKDSDHKNIYFVNEQTDHRPTSEDLQSMDMIVTQPKHEFITEEKSHDQYSPAISRVHTVKIPCSVSTNWYIWFIQIYHPHLGLKVLASAQDWTWGYWQGKINSVCTPCNVTNTRVNSIPLSPQIAELTWDHYNCSKNSNVSIL